MYNFTQNINFLGRRLKKEPREPENTDENAERAAYEINPLTLFMNYWVYICRYDSKHRYTLRTEVGANHSLSHREATR